MLSRFSIQRAKHYAPNWFDCLSFLGKVRQVLFKKAWKIHAVMKRKDSNCVGILSEQGEAATASNLSEYTIITSVFEGIWVPISYEVSLRYRKLKLGISAFLIARKVKTAKVHGKKFPSNPAASLSIIVHFSEIPTVNFDSILEKV